MNAISSISWPVLSFMSKTVVISAVGSPAQNKLSGRITDWRDLVMITGIAISAISFIAALAMKAYLAAVGFALTGGILFFAAYYVYHYKLENQHIKSSSEVIRTGLVQHSAALQSTNAELTLENQRLQQASDALQQKIDELQRATALLKTQADAFTAQNKELARQVGLENIPLDPVLQEFDQTFDENMRSLAQSMQRAQNVSRTVTTFLQEQRQSLSSQLTQFQTAVGSIQNLNRRITEQATRLAQVNSQRQKQMQFLKNAKVQLEQTQTALRRDGEQLKEVQNKLSSAQQNLKSSELNFAEVSNRLTMTRNKYETQEKELSECMQKFVAAKKMLEERVDDKLKKLLALQDKVKSVNG